jgi:membrane protein YqaA with SNARE-associated domain
MTYLLTLVTAFGSALFPLINIEAYLLGLGAVSDVGLVPAALAAAAGQTAGKVLVFLSARKALTWHRLERLRSRKSADKGPHRWDAWVQRLAPHRQGAFLLVLVSASVGLPPLLLVAAVAGGTRMKTLSFAVACMVGRFARFAALLAVPGLVGY